MGIRDRERGEAGKIAGKGVQWGRRVWGGKGVIGAGTVPPGLRGWGEGERKQS